LRPQAFRSALRSPLLTSHLGLWLGTAIGICFVTGILSHGIQHPPSWFLWPSRPVNLYRVTQGVHVATGFATVPLLAAKLWSVYPRLFTWPPVRDVGHALERASVAVLVASVLFQVVSGVLNEARWYAPMPFFFTAAHHWVGWLAVGALLVHLAVKLPVVRSALRASRAAPNPGTGPGMTRRGLLTTVGATAGLVTLATAGQTVRPLAGLSVLGPRDPRTGPQGVPVNKSAASAGVGPRATDPAYRLEIVGPARTVRLSLDDLRALPQSAADLPITCVEGWSAGGVWSGVRLSTLAALVGGSPGAPVQCESLQAGGRYRTSVVAPPHARDPLTLVALRLNGEPLHLDHGYPCRLIAPNRPGVMQTKWLGRIVVGGPA
jgi:DMSO/TMAO reductase YedYZ molybdopterin-dependent catalytic subunit